MRQRLLVTTGTLLLTAASFASAQQPPPIQQLAAPAAALPPSLGSLDFGFRGTSLTGDGARYERYGDLRDGAYSKISLGKKTDRYLFDVRATNLGYRDQRYSAYFTGSKVKFTGLWDSTPLNYTYLSSTPWVEASPDVFTLSLAARQAVQAKTVVGVPLTVNDLNSASIYRGLAQPFDLQARRDTADFTLAYALTKELGLNAAVTSTKKSGQQPWGASFAFNDAAELPMRLDNRTNDASANLEWANPKGMMRVGWNGSWFDNKVHSLVWDNAYRATDTNPFDPNGYSNGNGPAQGRLALPPSNSLNAVSVMGLYKMPAHSTVNGTVSFTTMSQNDALIPWTINPVINTTSVFKNFPGLASLPRPTAEAEVHGVNALLNLTTRPNRYVGLTARYRHNNHVNRTPAFDGTEYVRFDAVPEETGGPTEHFNITQDTFDLNATFNVMKYTSLRVGYGYDAFDRTGRSFSDMTDNIFRASVDTTGNQYVTVRGLFEYTKRKGSGFSVAVLEDGGLQPGLRFYDEADSDRKRGTLLLVLNPVEMVDLTFSAAAGRDIYKGEGHEFGLLDTDSTSTNIGVNVNPMPAVGFGATWGLDRYRSNQKSRQASPPPNPQFVDPSRDWTLNNDETVHSFNLYLDLLKPIRKTDAKLSYDYSASDNGFLFGGGRIASLAAASQFLALPNVTNKRHRLEVDGQYFFARQVGVGVGYWYEKFDVKDFATIDIPGQAGTPRIDYLGEISTGYGNRPYRGSTVFLRLLYLF